MKLLKILGICVVLSLLICPHIHATETNGTEKSRKELTTWQKIGLGGLLSATHAGIAAFDPTLMGLIDVCVSPYLGGHGMLREKRLWPLTIAFAGLGVYNLTVNEDDVSRSRIFSVNFAGMSAAMITSFLIAEPDQPRNNPEDRLQAGLSFSGTMGMLTLSYAF